MDDKREDSPQKPRKRIPWMKVMVLISLLMMMGAVTVQYLKWQETVGLEKRQVEKAVESRKLSVQHAVSEASEQLDEGMLDEAERSILLAEGLDLEGELSAEIIQLKEEYKRLKAEADKKFEVQQKREQEIYAILTDLEETIRKANIESLKPVITDKRNAIDEIMALGVGSKTAKSVADFDTLLESKRQEANLSQIRRLIGSREEINTEQEALGKIEEITNRLSRGNVPDELSNKAEQAVTSLKAKLQLIKAEQSFQDNLNSEKWEEAEQAILSMEKLGVGDVQIKQYRERLLEAQKLALLRDQRVNEMLNEVMSLDTTSYNAAAMSLVEQILSEAPKNKEALELKNKLQAHLDLIRVPGDVSNLEEAVRMVNDGGKITLGEGVFYAELSIEKGITIEGQGAGKTIIESRAETEPALHIKQKSGLVRLKNLRVQGVEHLEGKERNSLILVSADSIFENCEIIKSPGHGVAVIKGKLEMKDCKLSQNGWDGVTVKGDMSQALLTDCSLEENAEHGVDFWEGASGTVFRSKILSSSGSGIVVTGKSRVTIAQTVVEKNREAGVYVSGGSIVKMDKVVAKENILSGFVVKDSSTSLFLNIVAAADNGEAGYFLEGSPDIQGLELATGEGNKQGKIIRRNP